MRSKILLVLSLFVATASLAQWEPPNAPHILDNGGIPRVYYAHSYFAAHPDMAGLDDRISIHVQNFASLLKQVNGNCQAVVLFLDGMPIKGDKAQSCDPVVGHIRFVLLRTKQDDDAWHTLLGSPTGYSHSVSVSVGSDQQTPIPSGTSSIRLEVIPRTQFFAFIALFAFALGIFIYLCRGTSLIRTGTNPVPKSRPYSLSLFQMSFWFFLVIAAYVFMWLITDELDTITDSVLALIGIGSATALGATLIDQKKATPAVDESGETSKGFLNDLISDSTGVSLHRFQMFVWTLVLGVIFLGSVYKSLEMPEFSATLLGLMGISSGTYLGFKVPENAKGDTTTGPPSDPAADPLSTKPLVPPDPPQT